VHGCAGANARGGQQAPLDGECRWQRGSEGRHRRGLAFALQCEGGGEGEGEGEAREQQTPHLSTSTHMAVAAQYNQYNTIQSWAGQDRRGEMEQ
jgi:hypothetical protein